MEPIVFVNEAGVPTGATAPKLESHNEETELHLAFSCYIFNEKGEILATKRAAKKKVWPGFWTNSTCGHPLPGEHLSDAVRRRAQFELGMSIKDLKVVLQDYRYTTPAYNGIIENEFCPVFLARADSVPLLNSEEVSDYAWMQWEHYLKKLENDPNTYEQFAINDGQSDPNIERPEWSWWCKDQLKLLKDNETLLSYTRPTIS